MPRKASTPSSRNANRTGKAADVSEVLDHMDHDNYSDDYIRGILRNCRVIAMVGASQNWNRPSYFAMKYLQQKGYCDIPVNPKEAGNQIPGATVYAHLSEIPVKEIGREHAHTQITK